MSEASHEAGVASNPFERHPWITTAVILILIFGVIEIVAYFVVHRPGFYVEYNRKPSGYTVFKNNPKHQLVTQKRDAASPDVVVDENGFVSAAPVSIEKPGGTVRIFLMGGSAAFGADQNGNYRDIYEYPFGIYTFPDSIAGQLQAYLEARRPEARFEVVTAAAFTRAYHQSLLYYLEQVSRFSPDWVVSMDGYNDVNHLVSGTPYADRAAELKYYIDLNRAADCLDSRLPNTYCMIEGVVSRVLIKLSQGRRLAPPAYIGDFDLDRYTREHYDRRKRHFESGAARFLQTLRHEMGVMRADGVNFMFVLQPMLHRQDANKALSPLEQRFERDVAPPLYAPGSLLETEEPQTFTDAILVLKYFFGDYLSPLLEQELAGAGFHYLDMNRAIEDVPESVEFFTDYCHMTFEGNRLIAEAIGEKILSAY